MTRDVLAILDSGPDCYRIGWILDYGEDVGAILGDRPNGDEPDRSKHRDDWEAWKANEVAASLGAESDEVGYFWESRRLAKAALAQIEAGVRQEAPWPDWAKTAVENGWKAPKGWRP